jgi:hypothetical protein
MNGHPTEGAPEQDNVIDLGAYGRARGRHFPPVASRRPDDCVRVYVDLTAAGRLSYGLSHATSQNALYLLEPVIYLAGELLKLMMEDE